MTATREPSSVPWIGGVVLAVLIGGYAGAYRATVVSAQQPENEFGPAGLVPVYTWDVNDGFQYFDGQAFFAPIHWLDRRIRPHVGGLTP